ncbi:hypothetical protein B5F07_21530 [Lachnoclostridium sp. An169]|uniref:AraC family transcriptional regulator n=1 Tax=Lachnoclostridium sp. An169 TaxID=1965569 RepID=UPI000B38C2B5|nr:helix-turn-helix domain-containing protein [Lachnoclostridium sp. An169]OUP79847.1 hypothetical protein B5F07_21530 [Lachnoclostridium sp. An169]
MLKEKWKTHIRERHEKQKKNQKFQRIFLGISAGIIGIVLAGMSVLYAVMRELIIDQNIQMSTQTFAQVQKEFDNTDDTANEIATQVMLDDVCSELIGTLTEEWPDSIQMDRIRNQLTMYQTANPTVKSIYIYSSVPDLILTSGSRFGASSIENFPDYGIGKYMTRTSEYVGGGLIPRAVSGVYQSDPRKEVKVYTKILFSSHGRSAVAVNLDYEAIADSICSMDILNESRMLIFNEKGDRLIDISTTTIEASDELRRAVEEIAGKGAENREITVSGGEKYFISYLHSEESGWDYIKITKWEEVFQTLTVLTECTLLIIAVIVTLMAAVMGKSAVSLVRMQKKSGPGIHQAEINRLKEGFLSDFLHSRKLFTKRQLMEQMEKFDFTLEEEKNYTVLILQIEEKEKFKELYGEKGTYDIEFGYWNIFEEIFRKDFKISGVINKDYTLSFILETTGAEQVQERLKKCFETFLKEQKRFIPWHFFCIGTEQSVNLEDIPELNEKLEKALRESFFYPEDTYCTMELIWQEHSGRADYQKLEAGRLIKAVRCGEGMKAVYDSLTEELACCRSSEYMNAIIWLGITLMRNLGTVVPDEKGVSQFLVNLTLCEKRGQTDECFEQLFGQIRKNQEKSGEKKGMAGRLDEVKKYIVENFRDPNISLERLADEFGGSPNYMGRLFKKDTGISVSEYINEIRLREVMKELRETNRPAKEVAEQCGFISSNYFYTYFRKKTGMTPQTYRETWKESKEKEEAV